MGRKKGKMTAQGVNIYEFKTEGGGDCGPTVRASIGMSV
jgi:hypothetical protein